MTRYHGVKSVHDSHYHYYEESEPQPEVFRNLRRLKNSTDPINNRRIIFSAFVLSRKVAKERAERMKLSTDYQHNYLYYILLRDSWDVVSLYRYREVLELID